MAGAQRQECIFLFMPAGPFSTSIRATQKPALTRLDGKGRIQVKDQGAPGVEERGERRRATKAREVQPYRPVPARMVSGTCFPNVGRAVSQDPPPFPHSRFLQLMTARRFRPSNGQGGLPATPLDDNSAERITVAGSPLHSG